MTDTPTSAAPPPAPGRDWGRIARLAAYAVAAAVATLIVGLFVTDTIRVRPAGPSFAESAGAIRSLDAAGEAAAQLASRSDPPRELSNTDPLRLYVAGDSHVGIVGRELGTKVEGTGVVAAHVDFRESSGISNGAVRDWFAHARDQLASRDPEAVVFMIGSNDTAIVGGDGRDGVPAEWEQRYRARVAEMMDLLVGEEADGAGGRMVIWVGVPPLRNQAFDRGAVELNRIMRSEAAARPDVVFFDAYALFAAPGGGWHATTTIAGKSVRVRNGDGIHFTSAGGQHLADQILRVLDAHWHISDFADPDHPIAFGVEAGSSCVEACAGYTPPAPSAGGSTSSGNGPAATPEPETGADTGADAGSDAGAPPPGDDGDGDDPTTETTTPTPTSTTPTTAAPTTTTTPAPSTTTTPITAAPPPGDPPD